MVGISQGVPEPYVLCFEPLFRAYGFGGHALGRFGKVLPKEGAAESWEVSPYPPIPSIVANGPFAGLSLPEVAARWGETLLGADPGGLGNFPFLLKWLDVSRWLPVHVHPDDEQAKGLDGADPGKEEAWLILEAKAGAEVRLGFERSVTAHEIRSLAREGRVRDVMQRYRVEAGDVVRVPPRTPHAATGIVFLEIQQVSDRSIFAEPRDVWGHPWPPGRFDAELDRFLAITRLDPVPSEISRTVPLASEEGALVSLLETRHFRLDRYRRLCATKREGSLSFRSGPASVTCLADGVLLEGPKGVGASLDKGDTVVIPATLAHARWILLPSRTPAVIDLALGYGPVID